MYWFIYLNLIHYAWHAEAVIGVNIRIAKDHEYPYVVSIGQKSRVCYSNGQQFCSGVLISNKAVLTAAHCFDNKTTSETEVILGSVDLWRGTKFNVMNWITYDEWVEMKNQMSVNEINDIGIILLSETIDNPRIIPVQLSPLNKLQFERTKATILGYGITNNNLPSRFLIAGKVKILSRENCQERMRIYTNYIIEMEDVEFCSVAEPFVLADFGDSGGPIVNKHNQLIGLNLGTCPAKELTWYKLEGSHVERFLNKYETNLHVSVDDYKEFINDYS